MKLKDLSVRRLFGRITAGLLLSMTVITVTVFFITKQTSVLLAGMTLILCALVCLFVLMLAFGKRLTLFTSDLCQTLDHMINGNEAPTGIGGTAGTANPRIGYFPSGKNACEQLKDGHRHLT